MPNPPTIAHLQSDGVNGAWVTCRNPVCLRSTPVSFEAIRLVPETPFLAAAEARRFVCSACGSRRVDATPDCVGIGGRGPGGYFELVFKLATGKPRNTPYSLILRSQ